MGNANASKRKGHGALARSKRVGEKVATNARRKPSLGEVLDAAEQLDAESQVELIAILNRRIGERGRKRVISDVKKARREFAAGKCQSLTAADIVREAMS